MLLVNTLLRNMVQNRLNVVFEVSVEETACVRAICKL